MLATILAPCLLLSIDNDFEALGVPDPSGPVRAVDAALELETATVELETTLVLPTLSTVGLVEGAGWVGRRIGISPWIVAAMLIGSGCSVYFSMNRQQRGAAGRFVLLIGAHLLNEMAAATVEKRAALVELEKRSVPPLGERTVTAIVLRELARSSDPLSAQRLWERLDPSTRPGVPAVRAALRDHPTTNQVGRGAWSFGIGCG